MPMTGVHHCHLLSRPLLARETMTLGSTVKMAACALDNRAITYTSICPQIMLVLTGEEEKG